jgi:hypothetical protein
MDKNSTNILPVFNGAAKSRFGPISIMIETEPHLNPDIPSLLMRLCT